MSETDYNSLINKLDQFIRKFYFNKLIKGIIYASTIILLFYLFVIFVEYFGNFNNVIRGILFFLLILIFCSISIVYIVIPLLQLNKIGKQISFEQAAKIIGKHFSSIEDKLLNILQLKETTGYSRDLVLASIDQKAKQLNPIDFKKAININANKRYIKYLAVPLIILFSLILFSPKVITKSTNRIIHYNTDFKKELPYEFFLKNGSIEVFSGEDVSLEVLSKGSVMPSQAYILYNGYEHKMKSDDNGVFSYQIMSLQKNIAFKISDGKDILLESEIKVIPKPEITQFIVKAKYPKYIHKQDETFKSMGDLIIPEGTVLEWNIKARNTEKIDFVFSSDKKVIETQKSEDIFSLERRSRVNEQYVLSIVNTKINKLDSLKHTIQVIKDEFPVIAVLEVPDSTNNKLIYFNGKIRDDYGFSALRFVLVHKNQSGKEVERKGTPLIINARETQQIFYHFVDLNQINVSGGDVLEYYFEVCDNDGVNGKKCSKSTISTYKVPTEEEQKTKVDEANKSIKNDLSESIKEAKQIQKDLEALWKDIFNKKTISWDEKKKMSDLLQKQKNLEENLKDVLQKNQEKIQNEEDLTLNKELLEKQEKIQELFDNILNEDMKKMIQKMQEMMEEMNKDNLNQDLEKMKLSNKDVQKELDRTLELFKQLEVEQKLEQNMEKLEEIAKKEEELNNKLENNKENSETLTKEQEGLNKEFEKLKEDIKEMEKLNEDLKFPNEMPDTKQSQDEISKEMKKASEELKQNQKKNASKSQKNAKSKMDDMQQQMKNAKESMEQQSKEENLEDMRQLLENLVQLSFEQEDLMKEMSKTTFNDPKYNKQIQAQRKLKEDAKMIEDSLFALSMRVIEVQPIINKELNALNDNLEKTFELLKERKTREVNSRQQQVMTRANNLALLFDEIIQQMQQQKKAEASCDKPGAGGKPKSGNLKKMQEQLSKQLQQVKDEMGKQQGGKKEGGGSKGMSEKLAKMAAQQEAIRNELQKMMKELGKDGSGGNMQKISEMMEETETDIVNKRITQETINRQKEILTKLLESEKAERERDQDEQRESKESKLIEKRNPKEFFQYKGQKDVGVDVLKFTPPSMVNFYKQKVGEYFNKTD